MIKPTRISKKTARQILIDAQGLSQKQNAKFFSNPSEVITHIGYVQMDTISVVERAHHHILWSRLPTYHRDHIDLELNKPNGIFEYWSHARAYLPMIDYRFSIPMMERYRNGKAHWFAIETKVMKRVLDQIRANGPMSASDFSRPAKQASGWFERTAEKKAMEQLFMAGELMVSHRKGFRIYYDIRDRILPKTINVKNPTPDEWAEHKILGFLRSNGFGSVSEMTYLKSTDKPFIRKKLLQLAEAKVIVPITIEGLSTKEVRYAFPEFPNLNTSSSILLLSPFDNLVIQRARLKELFNFDYTIECYVPEPKRKYGYFCLPILDGCEFVGRLDAKANRKEKVLEIKSIHFESFLSDSKIKSYLNSKAFRNAIAEFASFNDCDEYNDKDVFQRR